MKLGDWLLLALVAGYCLWLLLGRKKKKCSGCCSGCCGCGKQKTLQEQVRWKNENGEGCCGGDSGG